MKECYFWYVGTLKQKVIMVPGSVLTMSTTIITSFLQGKFAKLSEFLFVIFKICNTGHLFKI